MTQVLTKKMTREAYLEFERNSEERYEFVSGELMEVEVAKAIHEILVNTIGSLLFIALRGTNYQTLNSNVKISVDSIGNYRYADVSVVPSQNLDFESDILDNAVVLFEVSSKSTATVDRGDKFKEYQTLASLQEYVLVSTEKVQVEVFRRKSKNEWDYIVLDDKSMMLELESIGVEMALSEIYERTNL